MSHDSLQLALEHHRTGQLRQAVAEYRAVLESDPENADAHLWLGILTYQAGRPDQAIGLLERAAALRPGDASAWHNLAQAQLSVGRAADAVKSIEQALAIEPNRAETLFALGLALLARKAPNDAEAAARAFSQAHAAGLNTAEVHYHHAVAHLACEDFDAAIAQCRAAISLDPNHSLAHYQQALAHRAKGEMKETRKLLLKAAEIQPNLAPAWCALAKLEVESGQLAIAKSLFGRAIKANPNYAPAHDGLGQVLLAMGNQAEANQAFVAAARVANGAPVAEKPPLAEALGSLEERMNDSRTADFHYALAGQYNLFPPTQVPTSILTAFYDRYADNFEQHLRGTLAYQVPELILKALSDLKPSKPLDMLDLGCGTGVCGEMLRPLLASLNGVDLSPAMIEKARARNVYDRLEVGDLVQVLRKSARSYDLLVAADVLIYMGDLNAVFEAAAAALRPQGLFIFSVEAGMADRFFFHQDTRRFTHSRPYLQHLASIHNLRQELFNDIIIRTEAKRPVLGYLVMLRNAKNG
jgi:predicted TPR repeat methyltransferase